jgi:hypothetical protein
MKLALAFLVMTAGICHADDHDSKVGIYVSGDELTTDCRSYMTLTRAGMRTQDSQTAYLAGLCLGYVSIALDIETRNQYEANNYGRVYQSRFCIPTDANAKAMTEVVANYADQHPEDRNIAGVYLITKAISDKFPCPN